MPWTITSLPWWKGIIWKFSTLKVFFLSSQLWQPPDVICNNVPSPVIQPPLCLSDEREKGNCLKRLSEFEFSIDSFFIMKFFEWKTFFLFVHTGTFLLFHFLVAGFSGEFVRIQYEKLLLINRLEWVSLLAERNTFELNKVAIDCANKRANFEFHCLKVYLIKFSLTYRDSLEICDENEIYCS